MTIYLCSQLWSSVLMFVMILCWIGFYWVLEVLWWGINILYWAGLSWINFLAEWSPSITPEFWVATPLYIGLFGLNGVLKV